MRHDSVSNFCIRDFVHIEFGRIVQRRTLKTYAGEERLRLVDGPVEDYPASAHEEDVGEEMEDVGCRLMDGEQDDARRLLEVAWFASISGQLAQRVHHRKGAKAVKARRWLVAQQNSRPREQLKCDKWKRYCPRIINDRAKKNTSLAKLSFRFSPPDSN